ncbi:SDR family oxidoreductase [Natronosalvus halobius]|uniref:SDR family oxidoreductase n=1 Tax=Natronosalvus halobius TaxID=2953746 RepID=UPI0020A1AD39|nr:SDR family oxidoreductase [Natronosalvus halobius]USZ73669.1 SDR family oxidoreductase [Natronosalvus halobius]
MSIMSLLENRTAVITGAASGVGRGIAIRFAEEGANVVVADVQRRPREGGPSTVTVVTDETDGEAAHVTCDVTSTDQLRDAIDAAEQFGGIDILVNNAGILSNTSFEEMTESEYDRLMDINVKGVFFGSQIAAKRMRENERGGAIINLSSVLGIRGSGKYVAYVASKGAVRSMTYALADELGPDGIRVNAIHPGTIETQMNREDIELLGTESENQVKRSVALRRLGHPTDIGNVAVFLASELSDYVTGVSIPVDGGEVNIS